MHRWAAAIWLWPILGICADTSGLKGVVHDPQHHPVPGAEVVLNRTDIARTATTDSNGEFAIGDVPVGAYTISVSAAGFRTASVAITGNDLSINFGSKGITSLLTETGVSGTGNATSTFGDGWYALGVDPTGNPSNRKRHHR